MGSGNAAGDSGARKSGCLRRRVGYGISYPVQARHRPALPSRRTTLDVFARLAMGRRTVPAGYRTPNRVIWMRQRGPCRRDVSCQQASWRIRRRPPGRASCRARPAVEPVQSEETRQQVIGLLTAAYTTMREGGTADGFGEMTEPLLNGLLAGSFNIQISNTAGIHTIVQTAVDQAAEGLESRITTLIATFLSAFLILCQEYEAACPVPASSSRNSRPPGSTTPPKPSTAASPLSAC